MYPPGEAQAPSHNHSPGLLRHMQCSLLLTLASLGIEAHRWLSPESPGSFPLEYSGVNQLRNYPPYGNVVGATVNGKLDRQHTGGLQFTFS